MKIPSEQARGPKYNVLSTGALIRGTGANVKGTRASLKGWGHYERARGPTLQAQEEKVKLRDKRHGGQNIKARGPLGQMYYSLDTAASEMLHVQLRSNFW